MFSSLAGLLLFQVALVSPNGGSRAADLLPADFGEWHSALAGAKPEKFASVDLPRFATGDTSVALGEFGFLAAERREYRRSKTGPGISVEAIRMKDASAAYGAFTWIRQQNWTDDAAGQAEKRRFQASLGPDEAVMQRNGFVLHIKGAKPTHQELSQLAAFLPALDNEPMPQLADFLPKDGLVKSSAKYASGPLVLKKLAPALPDSMGFNMGGEAVAAEYRFAGRPAMTLVLVEYPTPQIAQKYAKDIADAAPGVELRRRGTLVTIVANAQTKADADKMLGRVHFTMGVMWNQGIAKMTQMSVAKMIMSIFALCGILLIFCVLSGAIYGLLRVVARRRYPGQVFDRDVEVIELRING